MRDLLSIAFACLIAWMLFREWRKLLGAIGKLSLKPPDVHLANVQVRVEPVAKGNTLKLPSPKIIVLRPPVKGSEHELCKCGYSGCIGHEVINNEIKFPGFTSEVALKQSPHMLVLLHFEVCGVDGNPNPGFPINLDNLPVDLSKLSES